MTGLIDSKQTKVHNEIAAYSRGYADASKLTYELIDCVYECFVLSLENSDTDYAKKRFNDMWQLAVSLDKRKA